MRAYGKFSLLLLIFIGMLMPGMVSAQKKTKIRLVQAEQMQGDKTTGEELNIFVGDVIFEHDSAYLFCDSAVFNSSRNNLDAYHDVRIKVSDTLNLYGDFLHYEGNSRVATVTGDVKLEDNDATLYTDRLIYERNTKIAYYTTGGEIISEDNNLTSWRGFYYTDQKELYFKDSVVLINPEYTLRSDTLIFNTLTEIALISGPTTIVGEDEFLYAEDGWYNTQTDETELKVNPYLIYKEQYLSGDSIYYEKESGKGHVIGDVMMKDTVQNVIVKSQLADYNRKSGYAWATDSAMAILIDGSDSLFMHADTLRMTFDTTESPQNLLAYYKCKYYKSDLQGMSDSLVYSFTDSIITMYREPALWTQGNQLTADLIKIFSSGEKIDSMYMSNSSFIISIDEFNRDNFNQIKGKNMIGYFKENELYLIKVEGNSETVYYVREEDGALIGINKALSSNMEIWVEDRQISDIFYFDQADANLFPENEFPPEERRLKNFIWLDEERPKSKTDIFIWDARAENQPVLRPPDFVPE
ncbi:MAG: OstA-like protein [Bacteroidales bacterium]